MFTSENGREIILRGRGRLLHWPAITFCHTPQHHNIIREGVIFWQNYYYIQCFQFRCKSIIKVRGKSPSVTNLWESFPKPTIWNALLYFIMAKQNWKRNGSSKFYLASKIFSSVLQKSPSLNPLDMRCPTNREKVSKKLSMYQKSKRKQRRHKLQFEVNLI